MLAPSSLSMNIIHEVFCAWAKKVCDYLYDYLINVFPHH